MTYTIIIPVYNEYLVLPSLLNKLKKLNLNENIETIIIDDGSYDGTKDLLDDKDFFNLISYKTNLGKGAALKAGLDKVKTENIIIIDGDLEIDIEEIPPLIRKFEKSKKHVLTGIRWEKNALIKLDINALGNFFINYFFNSFYHSNFNDVLCCLKIMSLDLFKSLNIESNGFEVEVETMAKLCSLNSSIVETQISYHRRTRKEGKKLKISDGWKILRAIIYFKYNRN